MAIKGENYLVRISLTASDGTTPLLVSDLSLLSATIIQNASVIGGPYVYGTDDEIRVGDATNVVEVEITKSVANKFRSGLKIVIELTMEKSDADFEVDLVHKDIAKIEVFSVD